MPRKNVDDLKTLAEVLEVFEILNEKYDEDLNKTQLKELLRKILEHQSSGSGHYSTGISGLKIICNAKCNDLEKRQKLDHFYTRLEYCLEKLANVDLSILEGLLGLDTKDETVNGILSHMKSKLVETQYYLLIAGETSSGKSTMINLILNDDILPCHILHNTSHIWEVSYGEQTQITIHYKHINNEERRPLPEPIPVENKEDCGKSLSEQLESFLANKDMDKIDKFEIYLPHDLLKQGVIIVDSPGVGHSEEMDAILMTYLPKAFAYIYVIDIARAGGLEQHLKIKMKDMARKINRINFSEGGYVSRLTECTLFIGNKWDIIKRKNDAEKHKVKQNMYDELRKCWGIANIEKHVIFMSATDAIKVQDYGGITPEFNILLESINQLIFRSINLRLYNHWQWLDMIMSKIVQLASIFFDKNLSNLQGKRDQAKRLGERADKIQRTYEEHTEILLNNLQRQEIVLSDHLKKHTYSREFEEQLFFWDFNYANSLRRKKWEDTKENVDKAIVRKYLNLMCAWEKKEHVYAKIHSTIVDEYLKSFNLLKKDLEHFESGHDDSIEDQADYYRNRTPTVPTKVFFGVTLPIWLPVAAAGIFLGAPIMGVMALARVIDDKMHYEKYLENPVKYMKHRCERFLQAKREEDVIAEAAQLISKTKEIVFSYHNLLPRLMEADRKIIKKLENETRDYDEMYSQYKYIGDTTKDVREEMIDLGRELFPESLDRRDLTWRNTENYFIGEGEFTQVYRGHLKIVPLYEMANVAVKVFNKPFDDVNARFYFNEEVKIRHLKHENVLKFLGATKIEVSGRSKCRYVFVMPICKKNLREHLFTCNAFPTKSNDTREAITKYFKYAKQIADGLNYIHERRLVHRHLKMENILVKDDDKVAISDIGIVGHFRETEKSLIYLAPEVLKDLEHRIKAGDIYSFGIMLWEMWYGVRAFQELMPIIRENFRTKIWEGYRPKNIEHEVIHPKAQKIMEDCWPTDHKERITAKDCLERL